MPAFSCQQSPSTVSAELSLSMCCQPGDGHGLCRQTSSLLSHVLARPMHPKGKGTLTFHIPGYFIWGSSMHFPKVGFKESKLLQQSWPAALPGCFSTSQGCFSSSSENEALTPSVAPGVCFIRMGIALTTDLWVTPLHLFPAGTSPFPPVPPVRALQANEAFKKTTFL